MRIRNILIVIVAVFIISGGFVTARTIPGVPMWLIDDSDTYAEPREIDTGYITPSSTDYCLGGDCITSWAGTLAFGASNWTYNVSGQLTPSTTIPIYVDGYASTTGGLFTQGSGHYGTNLTIDGNTTGLGNLDISGDVIFDGEIKPDGDTCANNQILKKVAANDWGCFDVGGGVSGIGEWEYSGDNLQNKTGTSTDVRVVGTLQASSTAMVGGALRVDGFIYGGIEDTTRSVIRLYGNNATAQPVQYFYNSANFDTDEDWWSIGPADGGNSFYFGVPSNVPVMSIDRLGNLSVDGSSTSTLNGYFGTGLGLNTEYINQWSDLSTILNLSSYLTLSDWYATTTDGLVEGISNLYWTQDRWDDAYNSTTTLNGLTISDYLLIADFSTQFDSNYNATTTLNGFTNNQSDWNSAYSWGDHALAGYYAAADYDTDWDAKYNATTTLNGLTISDYLAIADFTSTADIWANASSTIGSKSYSDLTGSPSDVITAGTNLSWSGDTLNATGGGNPFNQWLDTTSTAQFSSLTLDTGITDVLKATAGVVSEIGSPTKNYALLWNGTAPVWAAQGTSFTFSNASFVDNQTATQEIGSGTFLAIGATSFTATYNNGPATSGSVQIVAGVSAWSSPLDMGSPYTGPTASVEAVPYPANPAAITFRLTAGDGVDSDTSDVSITLINNRFWGTTTKTDTYLEADVEGLAGSELSNSKTKSFSSTTGSGEYILWASRTALGTVTFTVDGFSGGFQAPETVSITNASGYTEDYYVYRSTNPDLGTITVTTD